MTDFRTLLTTMRRPRLLIRAARLGVASYQPARDLRRIVDAESHPERALPNLVAAEALLEETRRTGAASYSVARHIEVLIALIAEVRMLPPASTA